MIIGKSTVDKRVRQLKSEQQGLRLHGAAIIHVLKKIKKLEKKDKTIELEKEILKKLLPLNVRLSEQFTIINQPKS